MTARVRITADDAGALPAIDDAVLELLELGALTRAAAFANGPSFGRFTRSAIAFSVVPHVTLTYGCPLGDPRPLRPLLAANGNFLQPLDYYDGDIPAAIKAWTANAFCRCDPETAAHEIGRQVAHFEAITGRPAGGLTFHHDIDVQILDTIPAQAPACYQEGRAGLTRAGQDAGTIYTFLPPESLLEDAISSAVGVLRAAIDASRASGGQTAEAVFHPSIAETHLNSFTAYSLGRVREYQALRSLEFLAVVGQATRQADVLVFR